MKITVEASDLVSIMVVLAFCYWVWQKHRLIASQLVMNTEGKYAIPGTNLLVGSGYGSRN